jgi:hypothetical protein
LRVWFSKKRRDRKLREWRRIEGTKRVGEEW